MVLITDGFPNDVPSALSSATRLKSEGILLYSVGVGRALSKISSSPTCLHVFLLSNYKELAASMPDEIRSRTCEATIEIQKQIKQFYSNILEKSGTKKFTFRVDPVQDATVKFCITSGSVTLYGSWETRNPNKDSFDFKRSLCAKGKIVEYKNFTEICNNFIISSFEMSALRLDEYRLSIQLFGMSLWNTYLELF